MNQQSVLLGEQLLPIDLKQQALSEQWLTPHLSIIHDELSILRQLADAELSVQFTQSPKPYPLGRCLEISRTVYGYLQKGIQQPQSEAMNALHQFVIGGGEARRVWGALREQYFQNAFQLGNYYVDVANDTVDIMKPKIEILPLQAAGFVNLRDFSHFAKIGERYWQCTFYPNLLLPELAPLFPLFSYTANGQVRLHSNMDYMLRMNIADCFKPAEQYLRLEHRTVLPTELKDRVVANLQQCHMTALLTDDPEQALRYCRQYRKAKRMHDMPFLQQLLDQQQAFNLPAV
ncbi:hypothetical protein [Methylobacter sp.]|uniref:hypothetical protein n=1 Tax=Methylobacter sp. TaxID=2051955 RepID=UPI002FDE2D53